MWRNLLRRGAIWVGAIRTLTNCVKKTGFSPNKICGPFLMFRKP